MPTIKLRKHLRAAVEAGHPWIYRGALMSHDAMAAGTQVEIHDRDGFLCWAVYEPEHPIAARVWSTDPAMPPDTALVRQRLDHAWRLRKQVVSADVEAWRLLHGEADGCPGWTADIYKDVLVVRSDGEAAKARLPLLLDAITQSESWQSRVRCVVHRRSRGDKGPPASVILGEIPEPFWCREYAWQMEADVMAGQKTGWFVDQRENRRQVFEIASGLRVANLFSYTGGFSLAAALGGAAGVTSVDISGPATDAARRNFDANGLVAGEYEFAAVDAFEWLVDAGRQNRQFDLMIVDPPSFAPNQKSVPNARRAYRKLLRGAAGLLPAEGGLLAAASCSSHITAALFQSLINEAVADAGRTLQILTTSGAGPDHPLLPAFPEGDYLKFILCRVA